MQKLVSAEPPWGTLAAMTLARIAFAYQLQTVASLGPELVAAFAIDLATLGTLMGIYMLPGMGFALPIGFLARRFGDRDVMTAGLVLMTVGGIVSAAAGGPVGIGAGRLVAGTGAVALTVLQTKITADLFQGRLFLPVMSLVVGAYPIGIGLGQLTHAPLADAFGLPAAFVMGSVLAGVSLVLFLATWPSPRHVATGSTITWPSRREIGLVVVAGLMWTAYNAGYFNFLAFMPTYMAAHGHSHAMTDLVLTIASWGNLPSILAGGLLAARFGPARVFISGSLLSAIAVIGLGLVDWPILWATVFGLLGSLHAGIIIAIGTTSARPQNRAVGMALFYTTYYVGGTFIPTICGRAADTAGDPTGAFLAAGSISALALPLYWLHRRMAKAEPLNP